MKLKSVNQIEIDLSFPAIGVDKSIQSDSFVYGSGESFEISEDFDFSSSFPTDWNIEQVFRNHWTLDTDQAAAFDLNILESIQGISIGKLAYVRVSATSVAANPVPVRLNIALGNSFALSTPLLLIEGVNNSVENYSSLESIRLIPFVIPANERVRVTTILGFKK